MKSYFPLFALGAMLASPTAAHTILQWFWADPSSSTQSCIRMPPSNSPVMDVTSPDMACNVNGATPAATVCDVTAGSTVIQEWHHENREQASTDGDDPIASSHKGPMMVYLAKVSDAATERGVTALDWFKITEDGYANGVWATDTFYKAKTGKWSVKIPSNIPNGDYLLRGEMFGLHASESYPGAQLYMGCVQIRVTGGTGGTPGPTVKFPGAYKSTDPGITVNIWRDFTNYVIPGPPVFSNDGSLAAPSATYSSTNNAIPKPSVSSSDGPPAAPRATYSSTDTTSTTPPLPEKTYKANPDYTPGWELVNNPTTGTTIPMPAPTSLPKPAGCGIQGNHRDRDHTSNYDPTYTHAGHVSRTRSDTAIPSYQTRPWRRWVA